MDAPISRVPESARLSENRTIDELRVGESASLRRTLDRGDLRLWSALTGNAGID